MTMMQHFGIDRLSSAERITLAQEILESLAAEQTPQPLSESKRQELERRLADIEQNPDDEVPWEEIETAALARFKK